MQDVEAFYKFLALLPEEALCAQDPVSRAFARPSDPGYTPFRTQPSKSSQSDIQRCIHAMFRAWREMGYVQINPMGLHGAGTVRKVNTTRAVPADIYDMVFKTMDAVEKRTFMDRRLDVRDRFIFIALRELGLRASELVKASMSAFYRLADPIDGNHYWMMLVREETAKGRRERKIPVSRNVMNALQIYRHAFGLTPHPGPDEDAALILSPRTSRTALTIGGRPVRNAQSRRFFRAWRSVTTRHGLYHIIKKRLSSVADHLDETGDTVRAEQLRKASPHWLRHTFAKAALLTGQDIRSVAAWLGHRDLGTAMVYTEQEALDLIRTTNRAAPGLLAAEPAGQS